MGKEDSVKKKIIDKFEENIMKENVRKEVKRLLEESRESREDIEIVKEVIVQNSKQLFVIIPKDLERLLHIKEGNKIKFVVKIPAKKADKIQIKLEVNDERREV